MLKFFVGVISLEVKEIVVDVLDSLSTPVVLLEDAEKGYSILYSNKVMQKLLITEESQELKLTDEFLDVIGAYKNEAGSDNVILHDIEIFEKLYNISFSKNSNRLFITFFEISIEKLFDNITFRELSGSCSAIFVVLNSEGKVVDMNDCFLNFVGMKKEEVQAKDFFETFIPGDKETLNNHLENLTSNESPHQHFVTPMKGHNGKLYRIYWQVSSVVKQNQSFIIAVGSDISKFVEENSNLKRDLKNIKVGFDYFPFAIGYMNSDGILTSMNPGFMKMFRIKDEHSEIAFDSIRILKDNIGFNKMSEHIGLIKEMSYKIDYDIGEKAVELKVNIRMLSGKKESSKLYIVVVQKVAK